MAGGGPEGSAGSWALLFRSTDPRGQARALGRRRLIVLDASAYVEVLRGSGRRIEELMTDQTIRVPAHFDVEVFAGIRRLLRRKLVSPDAASLALLKTAQFNAERSAVLPMYAEAFRLRDRFSAGDAFYAVLARTSGALLVTTDARFSHAAAGYCDVEYVKTA